MSLIANRGALEVIDLVYLSVVIDKNDWCRKEVENYAASRRKFEGAINLLISEKSLSMNSVRRLHEGMLIPTLLYGSGTLALHRYNKSRARVVGISFLRRVEA